MTLECKKDEIKIEEYKWSDAIRAVSKILVNRDNPCEMKVFYNEKINKDENKKENMKKVKSKLEREFVFINKKYAEQFIFLLRSNYFKLTGSYLLVGVNEKK